MILLSGGPGSRFRQIPARAELWPEFSLSDAQWQALQIPIDLAFFLRSTPLDKIVALYPAPGGAIQSSPPPQAWEELAAKNPRLKELEADTEALLVNRIRGASEVYRAPIDECYRLAGLIRLSWRGWSGGAEMWDQVNQFFRELKEKSERGREGRDA